jgi:hypothetical protein
MSDSLLELVREAKRNEKKIEKEKERKNKIEIDNFEKEWKRQFGSVNKMMLRQKSAEGGSKSKKSQKTLSVFPDKSPQLQEKGVPTKLNSFTTKNVAIRDSKGREFNAIINDRLAYRRAPRGQNVEDFSEIIYGPNVTQLTSTNYKKLKKGSQIYYDRGSAALRGPFIFKNVTRGPYLMMEVKDTAYNKTYLFSIPVSKLNSEKLYLIIGDKSPSKKYKTPKTKKKKMKRKNKKVKKSVKRGKTRRLNKSKAKQKLKSRK